MQDSGYQLLSAAEGVQRELDNSISYKQPLVRLNSAIYSSRINIEFQ
jgi:hypothetical protein